MLAFGGFDWDDANWPKCGKHGVGREEIEGVFEAPSLRIAPISGDFAEERFAAFAMSPARGRWTNVIFAWRGRRIRPISARHMHAKDVLRNVT